MILGKPQVTVHYDDTDAVDITGQAELPLRHNRTISRAYSLFNVQLTHLSSIPTHLLDVYHH